MPIEIVSTTDSPEAVAQAKGLAKPSETKVETKPAEEAAPATMGADDALEATSTETEEAGEETETEAPEEALEASDDAPAEEEAEKPVKKKGGFQKRIDKLNKKNSDLEREMTYWREQAMKNQTAKPEEPVKKEAGVEVSTKPNPKNFDTNEDYLEALTDWKLDQKLKKQEEASREAKIKSEQQSRVETHFQRVEKFKEENPDIDLDDELNNVKHIRISLAVNEAIIESEFGPQLMHELASNPKEFERICKLSPIAAARAIGKIEAKFSSSEAEPSPKVKKASAPAPIKPVTAKGSVGHKNIYDPNLSMAEYNRIRDEQERQRKEALRR